MTQPQTKPATYQDVLDAPPNMIAEIAGDVLHLHPHPAPLYVYAANRLGPALERLADEAWVILDAPELHLGPDVLVPDLAGWRVERMPRMPETAWFKTRPDWVCEVVSPETRAFDLTEKRRLYGAAGVGWLWLVDPDAQVLEAFELQDKGWVLFGAVGGDDPAALSPFGEFDLARLWAPMAEDAR